MSISLGTECKASYNGKWYTAKINKLFPDGKHAKVKFKKFSYSPRLALSELRFSSNSAVISGSRCDYAEGDTVEVYFQGKWLGARVAKVIQEGYSYGVQYLNQRHATHKSQAAIHRFSPDKIRPRWRIPLVVSAGVTPSVAYPTPVPIQSAGVGIPVQPAGPAAPIQCPIPAPVYPTPSPIHTVSAGMTASVAYPTQAYPAPSVAYPTPVPVAVATGGTSYPTPLPGMLTVTGTVVAVMPALVVATTARPVATGDECQALYKRKWYTARVVKILDGGKKHKVSFADFKYLPTLRASQVRFSST